jgi:hypothetical protein
MRRAIAQEQRERQTTDRFASTLVIAASIIAAVRLAREDISKLMGNAERESALKAGSQ